MSTEDNNNPSNAAMLAALGEVKGQLVHITQLITANQTATNQRIDDLRHAMEGRMNGHEGRIGVLEDRERSTAIRTAGVSAITSAIVAAGIAAMRGH